MKNIKFLIVALFCLILSNYKINAQTEMNPTLNKPLFKYQDSVLTELAKYNEKFVYFPLEDPCDRKGTPTFRKDSICSCDPRPLDPTPEWPVYNPGLQFGPNLGKKAGDKNIFWIHGLNGTTETWAVAAAATQFGVKNGNTVVFPNYKVTSHRGLSSSSSNPVQTYTEDHGIKYTPGELHNLFKPIVPTSERTEKDFIIAHSQGGIVAREWLRRMDKEPGDYDKLAHGLVTFGTPHGGAKILNNANPNLGGGVSSFMDEACTSLGGALLEDKIGNSNSLITRLLISSSLRKMIVDKACDVLSNSIVPIVLDNYFKATTYDYYYGSPFLEGYKDPTDNSHVEGLGEYTLKVPVVQFYGVEEQPVLWKFMSSTMGIGHDKLDNNEKIFGYDQDDQLEKSVQDLINGFNVNSFRHRVIEENAQRDEILMWSLAAGNYAIFNIPGGIFFTAAATTLAIIKNSAIDKRRIYDRGTEWLSNANDYYLSQIVGAKESRSVLKSCQVSYNYECRDPRYNPVGSGVPADKFVYMRNYDGANCPTNGQTSAVNWTNYHYSGPGNQNRVGNCVGEMFINHAFQTVYSYKPSDGVVLEESARYSVKVNTTLPEVTQRFVLMPKSNHDQMKNSLEAKRALIDLYNGNHSRFFKTDEE